MNDIPRYKLRDIVHRYGLSVIDNPRRVRALLMDLCGQYRREIFVLGQAQEEAVPEDLQEVPDSIPLTMLISQLTHRMVENRALSQNAARWAVESWAYALGKPVEFTKSLSTPEDEDDGSTFDSAQEELFADDELELEGEPFSHLHTKLHTIQFDSEIEVDYYWRDEAHQESEWHLLGQTPDTVALPSRGQYKLVFHDAIDTMKTWASRFPFTKEVTTICMDKTVSDEGFLALSLFPGVLNLAIDNAEAITDEGFTAIQYLKDLNELKLTWCIQLSDKGFTYLASLLHLRDIRIEWSRITDSGIKTFSTLPAMTHLGLRECSEIKGNGFSDLTGHASLTSLDCSGAANLTDKALVYISEIQQLHNLNLSFCSRLTSQGLTHLRKLTQLAHLSLGGLEKLDDSVLDTLLELPQLLSLNLSHSSITNSGLARIKQLRELAVLDLSGCDGITDRGLRHLTHLPNLKHVNLSMCHRISSRGINRLSKPELTILV